MCASRHQTGPTCEAAVAGFRGLEMTDEMLFWRVGNAVLLQYYIWWSVARIGVSGVVEWLDLYLSPYFLHWFKYPCLNRWRLCLEVCYVVFGLSENYVLLVRGMIVEQSKTVQDEMVG